MTPTEQLRRFETDGATATEQLAAGLVTELADGEIVFVSGELGAGKTTFIRGAARALGATAAVTSPTFAIGHRYPTRLEGLIVCHLDLYRLDGLDSEDPELLAPYLGPGRITFIEWPEHGGEGLGEPRLRVELRHSGDDRRAIEVRG
jgi:tRNA threonylcarbamoyladenosine biosynthesis protein TsaE